MLKCVRQFYNNSLKELKTLSPSYFSANSDSIVLGLKKVWIYVLWKKNSISISEKIIEFVKQCKNDLTIWIRKGYQILGIEKTISVLGIEIFYY